jgi:AcrR family transcriptional regulator
MGFEYHNGMNVPYQQTGRVRQKARTREALIAATRTLLASGATPTVAQAAETALVSRTTAYRYFPTQQALLLAAYPEIGEDSVLGDAPPDDIESRFEIVFAEMARQVIENEAPLRAMLKLSLDGTPDLDQPLLRRGRRRAWVADALSPLRDKMDDKDFERLVLAITAATGIEVFVWLTDIARLTPDQALGVMRFSAQTLLGTAEA